MSNKTAVYLSEEEAKEFIEFCKYKSELLSNEIIWKDLKVFCEDLSYGGFNLVVKDGLPFKATHPIKTIIFGIE
ncbi:MAG: hypothetical protein HN402_07905 [Candidatus Scalindua sp.]|nr:hypothetical protein [Candidatus Scalindua sp.]MBT6757780.1 hypothetical protein [Candidatus Jacksonbacteria bacterium]